MIARPVSIYARRLREGVQQSGGMPVDLKVVRQKLLREMITSFGERLMVHENDFRYQDISSCPPNISMSVAWRNPADFLERFSKIQQDRRRACDGLIDALVKRKELSLTDNVVVPISWTVNDFRSVRTEPVPDLSGIADVKYFGRQKP